MKVINTIGAWDRRKKIRYLAILGGMLIFLPPLAFLPQLAGESNLCGKLCMRMFFVPGAAPSWGKLADNLAADWLGATVLLAILIVTFWFGRLWCGHLCPVGGAQEMVSSLIPGRAKLDFRKIPAPAFRYGYFGIYVLGATLGAAGIACKFCNFRVIPFLFGAPLVPAYRAYFATSLGLASLAVVVITGFLAWGGRAYCNFFCPIGAVDALVNRLGAAFGPVRRMRVASSLCTGCGTCQRVCPMAAAKVVDNVSAIKSISCLQCRTCEISCPTQAIAWRRLRRGE